MKVASRIFRTGQPLMRNPPGPRPIMITARVSQTAAVAALALLVLGLLGAEAGLRVNASQSIPLGLYRVTNAPVGKGEYVTFCPPRSELLDRAREQGHIGAGPCPGNYGYMMKRVAATEGDRVSSDGGGITVNGEPLPASAAREAEGTVRNLVPYPFADYTLKASELLLMSDVSWTSFDSRYFGPVDTEQVREVIRPVVKF